MGDVYYKLDKKTREELISTVKRVAIEILEGPKETWITADEVTKMSKNNILKRLREEIIADDELTWATYK